ncbi:MAG: ABATE domain-containing protein, partial [Sphingopyxis sp.]|nr:ABATE domain-containing protein [Sphingopyxis sp.]
MDDGFEFIAGSLALCFVDTLGGRGGMLIERLPTADRFTDWLTAANLTVPGAIADDDELSGARRLRSAISCAVAAIVGGKHPATDDADCINAFAAAPPLRPQLVAHGMAWT